ncbi:MAG: DUF4328 domain-containing protein [Terricaulis sp.]
MTQTTESSAVRDPTDLWVWLRGATIFYMVMIVAVCASVVAIYAIGPEAMSSPQISPSLMALGLGIAAAGLMSVLSLLFCIVTVCRLTTRMMRNLHLIGSPHVTIGPRWAAGWYFIPFANLIMPVKAVGEMWRGTFAASGEDKDPNGVIGLWWFFWITSNIVSGIAGADDSAEITQWGLILTVANFVLTLLACIFMLRVFGALARGQRQFLQASAFQ